MSRICIWLGTTALAVGLSLVPAVATAERSDTASLRSAEEAVEKLRAELARVNAEVAQLKRGPRSMRSDYRLRERMADAEALAHKLTAAEAKLRGHPGASGPAPGGAPIVAPPAASPQDGSVELEAKADLLVDQARKLDGEAEALAKAAGELRSRKLMRRKAGSWERDPFAGLETSRRNVAAVPAQPKSTISAPTSDNGARGSETSSNPTYANTPTSSPPPTLVLGPSGATAGAAPAPAAESTDKAGPRAAASEGAAAPKLSLIPQPGTADRQTVEQHLFLDPATAAELRQALGAGGTALDPEALERGAAALRTRARTLKARALELRARSRAP
jgi:hypothetical protein